MPARAKTAKPAKCALLPDAPKPWATVRPSGLHVVNGAISKATRDKLWAFFHPKDGAREGAGPTRVPGDGEFPWYQRFKRNPKTAHYNGWHSGKYIGADAQREFAATYPALHAAVSEAAQSVSDAGQDMSDVPAWGSFVPESVAVMRHVPNWGLGEHYDNAQDVGKGMVLMLSISDQDAVPRAFKFTDPPRGREFSVATGDSQAVVFGGECYDEWMHQSVQKAKQTGEVISMTVRLADVCGHRKRDADGNVIPGQAGTYTAGAPAAKTVAHQRIRAKLEAAAAATAPVAVGVRVD